MHLNNLIASIKKSNGDTLRESNTQSVNDLINPSRRSTVYLPFDSEYQIYIKNAIMQRALVNVYIDGTDVLGGSALVLEAGGHINLERFILDGNNNSGKKFLFVKSSDDRVQNPTSSENGLIKIVAHWEVPVINTYTTWGSSSNNYFPFYPPDNTEIIYPFVPNKPGWTYDNFTSTGKFNKPLTMMFCSTNIGSVDSASNSLHANNMHVSNSQKGATVEGGVSNQKFSNVSFGQTSYYSSTLEFQILAPVNDTTPITVKTTKHKYCYSCGSKLDLKDKYCSVCGTIQPLL